MIVIETKQLILRQLEERDDAHLFPIFSDPMTMSFWPVPFSLDATKQWINRSRTSYREHGFGRYAVVLRTDGQVIGDCGIVRTDIDGQPEHDLGYIIFHAFWGRGYATEAAEACKTYAFDTLKLERLCANMPADHVASRRVAEHIGMKFEKEFYNKKNRNILTYLYTVEQT
jgi:RimJ/RimL family protein N-acetyltransferase